MTLVSIYAPNDVNHRINFFVELERWIEKYSKAPNNILIGGDFNCCDVYDRPSKWLDKSIGVEKIDQYTQRFQFLSP